MPNDDTEQRRLAAIMFTDMVGYSALSQRNEKLGQELLEEHRALLRTLFPRFNGTEIKTIGDAFLVEFHSALEAAQCGIEIQRALAKRNHDTTADRRIEIKIGIHIGDVVHRGGDVYSDGVNIASRIEPLAGAGGICISVDVERQIRNAIETSLVKLGPTELKNIQLPMELFRVVLPWEREKSSGGERKAAERPAKAARPLALLVVATLVVVFVLAGIYFWTRPDEKKTLAPLRRDTAVMPPEASALDKHSIAVWPLDNISPDAKDEPFADGMTEELNSTLSKISGLTVKGRGSVKQYKKAGKSPAESGRELKVGTVLAGSVRKAGDQLRISVYLTDVASQEQLWSHDYNRELKEIFTIQSEVAQQVADALRVALLAGEKEQLAKKPTESLEAYKFYLSGRQQWNKRTEAGIKKAIDYFKQAIDKDPGYALAYAGLADSYNLLGFAEYGTLPPKEAFPEAKRAAQKAIELNGGFAEAHASLAVVKMSFDWDWPGAEKEFLRALELNPNYPTALSWYGLYLDRMGRFEEGLLKIKRAQELDPLAVGVNVSVGWHLYTTHDYDQTIKQYQKMIESDSSLAVTHWLLGRAYVQKAMYQEAITQFQTAITLSDGNARFRTSLGHALALSGKKAEAQQILDELKKLSAQQYVSAADIAFIHIGLGEKDQAFAWLDQAVAEHSNWLIWLKVEPLFNSLRSDPRFTALLKKIGLEK